MGLLETWQCKREQLLSGQNVRYIQSSPLVPSQFTEDSNLALWSSVSDLQGQVDSLQTALDSLQMSSATVDPISSPASTVLNVLICVASNCLGR